MNANGAHATLDQLTAFDGGQLPPVEHAAMERHVVGCAECCGKLEALPEDTFAALVRAFAAPPGGDIPVALVGHPRYRVLERVGAGGMGAVYKAVHLLMDRVVALKVIHRALSARPAFAERFRQEVQAAARLAHPNIVTAYDAEQADDLHFLVMEYVEGATLDRVVTERGPLPVDEACDLVRQAAVGLQHAFERGMVHRDIKPANLLRTPAGQLKILDFGLARAVRAGRASRCQVLGGPA